jgi:hypothetical protein
MGYLRKDMASTNNTPRLAVVASMIDEVSPADDSLISARLGNNVPRKAQPARAAEPTPQEEALAAVLHDGERDSPLAERAIAELLLLADEAPAADDLATGLSQALLLPDDSRSVSVRQEPRSAFADLYRRLALHQLNSQVRNKAAAILYRLIRLPAASESARSSS